MEFPISSTVAAFLAPVVAVAIAIAVHEVVWRVLQRLFRPTNAPVLSRVVMAGRTATRFAMVFAALLASVPALPLPPTAMEMLARAVGIGFIGALGWAIAAKVGAVFDAYLDRSGPNERGFEWRRRRTKLTVFRRLALLTVLGITAGFMLMTVPLVRTIGISLFASAGVAGIVLGIAARPTIANLIAGIQIALTQPIRIGDSVVVEGEWGNVDEITSTYVVVRIWDDRRLIVPLGYFLEKPFQNWTRDAPNILGSVMLYVDYSVPIPALRDHLRKVLDSTSLWDKRVWNLQVTDLKEHTMELRALVSAPDAGTAWDLRCLVREEMIGFLTERYPGSLPRERLDLARSASSAAGERRAPMEVRVGTDGRA
ncbi:mechanosensitive ion channel [Azospirillum sp. B21]|uniref:mechanosensitive ion channel family protein n=1 Tax=Azospirillum sp. B21 TaxID=2607496 RepID=UPI0011EE615D|nr:mechanosensitive ion channel domain-containing protein [Azospirillum sp. B21]KAA0581937.1 mechanosensitive ion channel [Azospirillum sp. B21]